MQLSSNLNLTNMMSEKTPAGSEKINYNFESSQKNSTVNQKIMDDQMRALKNNLSLSSLPSVSDIDV